MSFHCDLKIWYNIGHFTVQYEETPEILGKNRIILGTSDLFITGYYTL